MDVRSCMTRPCPVILNSTCVYYAGENLIYTGINTNDNLETALQKIDAAIGSAGTQINLTTTGASGPATLIGQTLNIPVYAPTFDDILANGNTATQKAGVIVDGAFTVGASDNSGSIQLASGDGGGLNTHIAWQTANGFVAIYSDLINSGNLLSLHFPNYNGNVKFPISVNGNFADTTGNITVAGGSQNLQQVTDVGNTTTNPIIISNLGASTSIYPDYHEIALSNYATDYGYNYISFIDTTSGNGINIQFPSVGTLVNTYTLNFPLNLPTSSYIIPVSVNGNYADSTGNINASSVFTGSI
jgi:hypothetical protein